MLIDIETAPNLAHVWQLFKQNIAINQIQKPGYMLCYAAQWYGQKEIIFDSVQRTTKKKFLKNLHALLSECDAVVHYNGERFDIPTINTEFIQAGIKPPAPYRQIDLYRTAKSKFRFPSNKLDYISIALGLGQKEKHEGHELWTKCMAGNEAAWKTMERYNKQDIRLLSELYDTFKPWITQHPNHGAYTNLEVCPNCGSTKLQRRGVERTQMNVFARFHCQGCGKWSRSPISETTKEDRQKVLR